MRFRSGRPVDHRVSKGIPVVRIRSKYGLGNRVHQKSVRSIHKNPLLWKDYLLNFARRFLGFIAGLPLGWMLSFSRQYLRTAFVAEGLELRKSLSEDLRNRGRVYFQGQKPFFHGE